MDDKYFIFLIAFLVSLTPFAIDTYLVAMPQMASFFAVNLSNIEITVSIFLVGYAIGAFIGGPLSDRFGRKKVALIGLGIFIFSSFMIFLASIIEELWIFRFTQAFGGGFALINGASSIRDRFSGQSAAKVFSTLTLIMSIPPLIAPAVGAVIVSFTSWKYIFLFLTIYSSLVFLLIFLFFPNGIKRTNTNFLTIYKDILTHKIAIRYILVMALCFGGLFIFIAKSSFIYIHSFGISTTNFPYIFGANVVSMMIFNRINFLLLKRFIARNLLIIGVIIQTLSGFCLAISSLFEPNFLIIIIFITLYIGSLGLIFGNSMALALEFFPHCSGSATAVIGITEFLLSGIIGIFVVLIGGESLTPFFVFMFAVSLSSLIILLNQRRYFKWY